MRKNCSILLLREIPFVTAQDTLLSLDAYISTLGPPFALGGGGRSREPKEVTWIDKYLHSPGSVGRMLVTVSYQLSASTTGREYLDT